MVPDKSTVKSGRRLSRRVGAILAVLIASATIVTAASQWYYGTAALTATWHTVCCDINGNIIVVQEIGTSSFVGYYGDKTVASPKVGEVYYTFFNVARTATTNGSSHMEMYPPAFTSFAISAAFPVRCWFDNSVTNTSNTAVEIFPPTCPQTPTPLAGNYGWSFNNPPSGAWRSDANTSMEIWVPMVSTQPLNGSVLNGYVYAIDGINNVWAQPQAAVWVYPNPPTISYPAPSATSITSTSAHLTANLLNHYATGTAFFDFGTSTAYGTTVNEGAITAVNASDVWDDWTGLTPSTTYHWRLRFVETGGAVTNGADQIFTTAPGSAAFFTLTVSKGGTGTGTVTTLPSGINCDPTCAASFPSGSSVTVTVNTATGSTFSAWGGACATTIPQLACVVTMSAAQSVTASFTRQMGSLSVTLGGLPAGETATLGITGPDGFNQTPTMTTGTGTNYSSAATGTYTVTAPIKVVGGATYSAPVQNAVVSFGATTTMNVIYSLQAARVASDFNGDGQADFTIYRPSAGTWYIKGQGPVVFGAASDIPVPGNYDNDSTTDIAVFRPSTGTWYLRNIGTFAFGASGDIPVPADYDGDKQTDIAVFRPGTGTWYVRNQSTTPWGAAGDIPVAGNYNGDSRAEIAVFRPLNGTWYVSGQAPVLWGAAGDIPVPADYNGDGVLEIAVYRPSNGTWYIRGVGTYPFGGAGDMPVPQNVTSDDRAELVVYRPDTGVWYSYNTLTASTTADPFGAVGDMPVLRRLGVRWLERGDVDGDRRADPTVFRPLTGTWFSLPSSSGLAPITATVFGASGDVPVPGDYRGLGRTQAAVFRPSTGTWHVNGLGSFAFGAASDLPIPADYDGDGRTDLAVFRPSSGVWYVRTSSSGFTAGTSQTWGASGDVPAPGDYDGDRRADLAVFRPSTGLWYVLLSASGFTTSFTQAFGATGDLPVVGDYDGDGRTDLAVFRPSSGTWYVRYSSTNFTTGASTVFGASGDTPVAADYDGDGRTDFAVHRASTSTYYVLGQFSVGFGTSGDLPVLKQP